MKLFIKLKSGLKLKNYIFVSFIIVYSIILIYLSFKINISEDESYTLNTTSHNLARVIKQAYNFENQPPVYFILLFLWRLLHSGIFFAKLFSLLIIGLSAYVFYRLALLFTISKSSKWMVIIFLLNPFTVWAALEMRTYALLILLSTLSAYFFFRYYFEEKRKFLYIFLFISAFGMYTQYLFAFLIATLAFIILIYKGWRTFLKFCLYLIPIGLVFLPNLIFLPNQISVQESSNIVQFPLTMISKIAHTPQSLMLAINLIPNAWINRFVRIAFLFSAIYIYFKLYKKHLAKNNSFFEKYNIILFSILILLILFSVGFIVTGVGYADKYMATVFPLFILLFIIFENYSLFFKRIIFSSISIYFIVLLAIHYWHPVKTYDFISIANYIQKIERHNEPILTYRPGLAIPFSYYYNGKNKIVPIPHPVKFDSSYIINIKDTIELKQSIESINSSSKSYLLISDNTPYESTVNMNRQMLADYLKNHYCITLDTLYSGWSSDPLRIMRLEKQLIK